MLTQKNCSYGLHQGSNDAGLPQSQYLGSDRSTERVRHVIGAHSDGQDEGDDEPDHDNPNNVRIDHYHDCKLSETRKP